MKMMRRPLTRDERERFLVNLVTMGPDDAARALKRSATTFYRLRMSDPDFRARWEAIKAVKPYPVRDGYVPMEPYREAIRQQVARGSRMKFGQWIGFTPARWRALYGSWHQKSIRVSDANRIAEGLGRVDLLVESSSEQTFATLPDVGVVRPKTDLASTTRDDWQPTTARRSSHEQALLERADRARKLLRLDPSIHPADALAMVVWPPERFLDAADAA